MYKKLINIASDVVPEFIDGLIKSNSSLKKVNGYNVVVRSDIEIYKKTKVCVISGGGSGHEPAHAGYIGHNMLSGAAIGNVFASPSVASVLAAIRCCNSAKGVLVIVKNYTGDRLNFGMAIEKARAEGINARMLIVEDDCALDEGKGITGGRGVAGTVFVHKIAGACAEEGLSLDEVYKYASEAASSLGTMGVALSPCIVPGSNHETDRLTGEEVEVGMGIHGEPGRQTISIPKPNAADQLSDIMLESIIGQTNNNGRLKVNNGDNVAVMVNNLGATPLIEMFIVARRIIDRLKSRSITPVRVYVGNYMTSLEMAGVSITIMKVIDNDLMRLDTLTTAPGWIQGTPLEDLDISTSTIDYTDNSSTSSISGGRDCSNSIILLKNICEKLISLEPELTQYDSIAGDGDCGLVMKAGAEGILKDMSIHEANTVDSAKFCAGIADSISKYMGGTSGALLELALRAMAQNLSEGKNWYEAVVAGVEAMKFYGGADEGMRTMLDALIPAVLVLKGDNISDAVTSAAKAATAGAESTRTMASCAGRSNYISKEKLNGIPDPGAWAMAAVFNVAADTFK